MVFVDRAGLSLCPVSTVQAYIGVQPTGQAPTFLFADEHALTWQMLVNQLCRALHVIGVDHTFYSGHSFRIGAATSAHAAGIEDSLILMLGRWELDAVLRYIRTPSQKLAQFSQKLSKS